LLRALGTYSPLVEEWGCDFLVPTQGGWCGVQRKEVADLVASVRGDRIARELGQIAESPLVTACLVIEGHTTRYGDPFDRLGTFSRAEYQGLILSIQSRGIWVVHTLDLEETAEWLTRLPVWLSRGTHSSLLRVPKPRRVSTMERLLMQLPGVSLGKAAKIVEKYPAPFRWAVTRTELEDLPGFGQKSVGKFYDQLEAP
jgi:ERCC4-type nuclease